MHVSPLFLLFCAQLCGCVWVVLGKMSRVLLLSVPCCRRVWLYVKKASLAFTYCWCCRRVLIVRLPRVMFMRFTLAAQILGVQDKLTAPQARRAQGSSPFVEGSRQEKSVFLKVGVWRKRAGHACTSYHDSFVCVLTICRVSCQNGNY